MTETHIGIHTHPLSPCIGTSHVGRQLHSLSNTLVFEFLNESLTKHRRYPSTQHYHTYTCTLLYAVFFLPTYLPTNMLSLSLFLSHVNIVILLHPHSLSLKYSFSFSLSLLNTLFLSLSLLLALSFSLSHADMHKTQSQK